ncbi:MAG: transglutaminase, partial [Clostridiales bacterium]|nr:transglutaminase [Clostridiales bacterium]
MNISSTGIAQENIKNTLTAGGMYSIGLDYGIISVEEMTRISERIEKVKGNINVDNIYTDEG